MTASSSFCCTSAYYLISYSINMSSMVSWWIWNACPSTFISISVGWRISSQNVGLGPRRLPCRAVGVPDWEFWLVGVLEREWSLLTDGERLPGLNDRPHLPYVEAVFQEICRWFPPANLSTSAPSKSSKCWPIPFVSRSPRRLGRRCLQRHVHRAWLHVHCQRLVRL